MNNLTIVKNYLGTQPLARERKNKNRAIGNMLIERYPLLSTLPKSYLTDVVGDALGLDRAWRKALETNEDLRGSDYVEKEEVEGNWKEKNL